MLCSFNPEGSSQYTSMLHTLSQEGGEAADDEARNAEAMDGDEDLQMERGNDLAPNRVCPLSMREVGTSPFPAALSGSPSIFPCQLATYRCSAQ